MEEDELADDPPSHEEKPSWTAKATRIFIGIVKDVKRANPEEASGGGGFTKSGWIRVTRYANAAHEKEQAMCQGGVAQDGAKL